jgi:hypothetical protein
MPGPLDRNAVMDQIAADLKIKRRGDWKATAAARPLEPDWDYSAIVIHNSGHNNLDDMQKIQKFDLSHRHWDDIAYHYGIMPDGTIFEGRQLIYKGADVKNQNSGKVGIVCVGDYDSSVINWYNFRPYSGDPVTSKLIASIEALSRRLMKAFPTIAFFGGHIEYGDTYDCPGSNLMPQMDKLRKTLGLAKPVKRSGL